MIGGDLVLLEELKKRIYPHIASKTEITYSQHFVDTKLKAFVSSL